MARGQRRFTIYDMMEAKGVFEQNPANVDARDNEGASTYKGPVEYPKMFYHPEGKEKIIVQPEAVVTPFGPKLIGEQREIIHVIINNPMEESQYRTMGWHDHPAKAIAASGKEAPSMGSSNRIAELEKQIADLQAAKLVQENMMATPSPVKGKGATLAGGNPNPKLAELGQNSDTAT